MGILVMIATMAAACGQPAPVSAVNPTTSTSTATSAASAPSVDSVLHGRAVDAVFVLKVDQPALTALADEPGLSHAQRLQKLAALQPSHYARQQVMDFVAANHLPVVSTSPWSVTVGVTPAAASSVFGVTLEVVRGGVGSVHGLFVAPSGAIAVPGALHGLVSAVVGLDTRPVAQPGGDGGPVRLGAPR